MSFAASFMHHDCLWVAERIDGAWVALYRFDAQDGYPVLAELRVVPTPDFEADLIDRVAAAGGLPEGVELDELEAAPVSAWRRLVDGEIKPGPARAGGLTSRGLRTLHLGQAQEHARQHVDFFAVVDAKMRSRPRLAGLAGSRAYDSLGYEPAAVRAPRRPGRRGREDYFYAEFAEQYVDAFERGSSRPVADVAEVRSRGGEAFTAAYVRDVIHQARRRGLLTDAPEAGKPGGRLTGEALAALQAHRGDAEG